MTDEFPRCPYCTRRIARKTDHAVGCRYGWVDGDAIYALREDVEAKRRKNARLEGYLR